MLQAEDIDLVGMLLLMMAVVMFIREIRKLILAFL